MLKVKIQEQREALQKSFIMTMELGKKEDPTCMEAPSDFIGGESLDLGSDYR